MIQELHAMFPESVGAKVLQELFMMQSGVQDIGFGIFL